MLCPSQMKYNTWSLYVQNSPLCSANVLLPNLSWQVVMVIHLAWVTVKELALHLGRMSLRVTRVREEMQQPLLTASWLHPLLHNLAVGGKERVWVWTHPYGCLLRVSLKEVCVREKEKQRETQAYTVCVLERHRKRETKRQRETYSVCVGETQKERDKDRERETLPGDCEGLHHSSIKPLTVTYPS